MNEPGHKAACGPCIILGIERRSGTNFLADLLNGHADCVLPATIHEDYLLSEAGHLRRYVSGVTARWNPEWANRAEYGDKMLAALGEAALDTIRPPDGQSLQLLKTPSVLGLSEVFSIWPACRLIIIVRDGRALVESGVRSFGWDYEEAIFRWDRAAGRILDFMSNSQTNGRQVLLVRYEDLHQETRQTMEGILRFLQLDPERYDFAGIDELPVRGSSAVADSTQDGMHWDAVAKSSDFNPLDRWRSWPSGRLDRFNWIAGARMAALGYEDDSGQEFQSRHRFANRWRDVMRLFRLLYRRVRTAVPGTHHGPSG